MILPIAGLVLLQTDLGSFIIICFLSVVMMVASGVRFVHLVPALLSGGAGFVLWGVFSGGNRFARLQAWFANGLFSEPSFWSAQSLQTIQRGGVWGMGAGNSIAKYRYMPTYMPGSHTDFVFSIGAEELGLFFSLAVILLFIIVLVCGVIISLHAHDKLGKQMAFGLTLLIVLPAMFNLAGVTGLAPVGVAAPLPFFSYGGSSICAVMISAGLLVNFARDMDCNVIGCVVECK